MRKILPVLLVLMSIGVSALAQTSSINGTVADPTNTLISGVSVTVTDTATGVASTVVTNNSGLLKGDR